jgi:predicted transcriptional regulator
MATTKKPTAVRLTDDGKLLLEKMAKRLGVSQTAVMEMAIREMADRRGVEIREATPEPVAG